MFVLGLDLRIRIGSRIDGEAGWSFNYHMISNKQTIVKNEQQNLSQLKVNICRQLFESGMSGPKIEAAMRSFGFEDFSCRILYRRGKGRGIREGWIREFGWDTAGSAGALASGAGSFGVTRQGNEQLEQAANVSAFRSGTLSGEGACVPGFTDFVNWLKDISPNMNWDWKFQQVIYDALERITSGENKRLMINIPPRHGKSELVTVRYLAWRLLQKPETNIILASYGQSLANRFSRKIRQVISDHVAMERKKSASIPACQAANAANDASTPSKMDEANVHYAGGTGVCRQDACAPVAAASRFRCARCRAEAVMARLSGGQTSSESTRDTYTCRTTELGNIDECSKCGAKLEESEPPASAGGSATLQTPATRQTQKMFPFTSSKPINTVSEWGTAAGGGLKAVGVGAGVTGFGADLIMVDDPVKNRAQAESETFRNRLWDWYTDDLYTRLEPNGAIVLIQTRWHEDDLAGRLIKQMNEGGEKWEIINLPAIKEEGLESVIPTELSEPGTIVTGDREATAPLTSDDIKNARNKTSLKGTQIIAQGKAEGRDPGLETKTTSDPEGVEQPPSNVAPLQGADNTAAVPGVPPKRLHPGLLSPSPSATHKPRVIGYPRLYSRLNDDVAPLQGADPIAVIPEVPPKRLHPGLISPSPSATPETSETSKTPATSETSKTSATSETPQDWRVVGEALCPPRYDVPKLMQLKDQLGTYSFSALYQQQPNPAEGSIFKREWLKNIVDKAPPGLKWFRGYDLAISTKTTADYTASVRVAIDEMGVMYIADGFRKRIEYPEQRRYVFERIMQERDTQHGIENSGNAAAIVSELRRQRILMRWPFRLVPVTTDKTTRALTWSPRAEEGKLKLVRGPWIDDFIEELIRFPVGQHDDQVDAVSVAVAMMGSGEDRRLHVF